MEIINTTPARNSEIYNNYEKAKAELESLFENLSKHEKEHPGETFGYSGIPYCLNRTRKKGIDKIFFVGRDYHGKYEDDYCYFTYWDEDSKEFFSDEWGTWAAFPHYDYYEMPISFGLGWELGLIDKEAYLNFKKSIELDILSKATFNKDVAQNYNMRVSVDGGRKFKGEGYLIGVDESSYRFATPMYRSRYYGTPDNFGVSTTYTALIWNPIDNTINRANLKYVKYMDSEEIMEKYIFWAKSRINNSTINDIKSNNKYNNGCYILDIDYSFETFISEVWAPEHNIGDVVSTAYDPYLEELKKKESEFRASKMPEIIEWVKNNTDKRGEDIMILALHIYNKNYGKN